MADFFGMFLYAFGMILFMIGMLGMVVCYIVMPLRTLWLVYKKFKPHEKYPINQRFFKISIWCLCLSFVAIAGYHLAVLNIKYPDSFLTVIYHLIPFGLYSAFEYFQEKAHLAILPVKIVI
jgi:polyferredoxin